MSGFNKGRPFHGSERVSRGGLKGTADTDYFYFLCPQCPDERIMRVLDYEVVTDEPPQYAKSLHPAKRRDFIIAYELHCQHCGHHDFVKVANIGWQMGSIRGNRRFGNGPAMVQDLDPQSEA